MDLASPREPRTRRRRRIPLLAPVVVLGVLAAPLATPGGPAAYALASKSFCLADAEPRDLGILVWELRNPRPRYDPPQLWHRYADLWVTYLCAPEAREAFAARLRVGEQFTPDSP